MKDLTDFIAIGKELGFEKDKLLTFAQSEYEKYLKAIEAEKQAEEIKEEKKRQIEYELAEKAEQAKFEVGVVLVTHMCLLLSLLPLMRNLMIWTHGFHYLNGNVPYIMAKIKIERSV